jgi:hypothetical protein
MELVKEGLHRFAYAMLAFKLECPCECYADEDFKVVSQSGDQSKKFLCHAHAACTGLLSVREKGEQIDCLAAEHAGFSDM